MKSELSFNPLISFWKNGSGLSIRVDDVGIFCEYITLMKLNWKHLSAESTSMDI